MGVAKAALESSARYLAQDLDDNKQESTVFPQGIRTLAASGVKGLRKSFDLIEERAPSSQKHYARGCGWNRCLSGRSFEKCHRPDNVC